MDSIQHIQAYHKLPKLDTDSDKIILLPVLQVIGLLNSKNAILYL